ncbi:N-acetyltransferase [bacterium AH-315-C07]|nr:N-acetyltransferase [bacterium AH-315-C07]
MIRLATREDGEAVLNIYQPYVENTHISFEQEVPSLDKFKNRIEATLSKFPWLVFEENGSIIGYAYACEHRSRVSYRWNAEVSVYLNSSFQGKGIATKLYSKLIELLKNQGYCNVLAGIVLPNDRSVQFHKKLGFTKVGIYINVGFKNGEWHDVLWMQMQVSSSNDPNPPEPKSNFDKQVSSI